MEQVSVFVIAPTLPLRDGGYAITTRPKEPGRIGLPGGKVDAGESLRSALVREAKEEGFELAGLAIQPFFSTEVEGNQVYWFAAAAARPLAVFKESHRLQTGSASLVAISRSGYENDAAVIAFLGGTHS